MSIAATLFYEDIQYASAYAIYAEARLGGNGDPNGMPELVLGDANDATYERKTWDSNLSDGFDTGNVGDSLAVTLANGESSASVSQEVDSEPITYSSSASGLIQKVDIRAFAQAAGSVQWSNVSIRFYRGGILMDSYLASSGPGVDTSTSENTTAETILDVTPEVSDCDQVVISGSYRMTYDSENLSPGPTDLAGQIFIYTT